MKKILYFMAGALFTLSTTAIAATGAFTDQNSFASWYQEAVLSMNQKGVITGYSDGSFGPSNNVNRAELAVMFDRFDSYLADRYTPTYTEADSGTTINLKKGQEFTLRLQEHNDGGYGFDSFRNQLGVILGVSMYQDLTPAYLGGDPNAEENQLDGAEGSKIWTFIANQAGETDLNITISQGWDSSTTQTVFQAHVVVTE